MNTLDIQLEQQQARFADGDPQALGAFFSACRDRLRRMVYFRMDPRLRGRIDPDDVVQEAFIDASRRIRHYHGDSASSLFVWLRLITRQTLTDAHRHHLGAAMRDPGREIAIQGGHASGCSTATPGITLLAQLTSPSQVVMRAELSEQLGRVIEQMSAIDREVLTLRHFEELSNSEVALELGIKPKTASIRYIRAVRKLRDVMQCGSEVQVHDHARVAPGS